MATALRLISLVLISSALVMLGADAVTSLDKGGELTVRSLEQFWALLSTGGPEAFKDWMAHTMPVRLTHGIETAMTMPGWAITGVPGVIVNFLSWRSHGEAG